jgi:hypothetical protein
MPTFPRRTVLKGIAAAPVASLPSLDSSTDQNQDRDPTLAEIMGYPRYKTEDVGLTTDSEERLLIKFTSRNLFERLDKKESHHTCRGTVQIRLLSAQASASNHDSTVSGWA